MVSVYVDSRYEGDHGIARYAREVVSRLTLDWVPLGGSYQPGAARDVFCRERMRLPKNVMLYNPGYTTGPSRATQLITIHDLIHLRSEGLRGVAFRQYYERVVRPTVRRTGHVITVSGTSACEIREWLADDSITVHDAGNGCSEIFGEDHGAEVLDRPYFLYVGNFKPHKNPAPLFQAMRQFEDHALVVVTGDRESAEAMAASSGIVDRTVVKSGIDDLSLSRLYRGCEALVFPSVVEGFGLPVLEAIKSGAKVVYAQTASSVAEICGSTQFGVEDASDSEAFAHHMEVARKNEFRAPEKLENYTWGNVARHVERAIQETLP